MRLEIGQVLSSLGARLQNTAVVAVTFVLLHSIDSVAASPPQEDMDFTAFDFLSYTSNDTANTNGTTTNPSTNDSMSVMWYIVSFGGLITFFILLSVSEFCCKKSARLAGSGDTGAGADPEDPPTPPPYELFAPPTYESLFRSISDRKRSFRASVYLIPVHDKSELPRESPLEFGEVIRRNPMGDGEVVTPPPPP